MFQPATAEHVEGVLRLMRDYYQDDGYPFDEPEARGAVAGLIAHPAWGALQVALDGGEVVAYLAVTFGYSLEYRGRDAFIDELVVAPSHQGRGLGKKALAAAEALCREAGVRALHLEVERDKPGARRLYEGAGFEEHSRHLLTKHLDPVAGTSGLPR